MVTHSVNVPNPTDFKMVKIGWWDCKTVQLLWKTVWQCLKKI